MLGGRKSHWMKSERATTNFVWLLSYAVVGWIVISVCKVIIGDPLTYYLDASHSNTVLAASILISIVFHIFVGFSVLHFLKGIASEEAPEVQIRIRRLYEFNPSWEADIAHCKEIMRKGSKSFFLASMLLPWWMRCASLALYSFCRQADDEVDEVRSIKTMLMFLIRNCSNPVPFSSPRSCTSPPFIRRKPLRVAVLPTRRRARANPAGRGARRRGRRSGSRGSRSGCATPTPDVPPRSPRRALPPHRHNAV